jgi:hypothetical protein
MPSQEKPQSDALVVRPAADNIPDGLRIYFQEYNLDDLRLKRDANLIIERTLEFGTWEELRWLLRTYGARRIRWYLRHFGVRGLRPATFNYWRRLLRLRGWHRTPFPTPKGELWNP